MLRDSSDWIVKETKSCENNLLRHVLFQFRGEKLPQTTFVKLYCCTRDAQV